MRKTRKFTYWVCLSYDSPSFNLRAKTRKEVKKMREENNYCDDEGNDQFYKKITKVQIEYIDLMDLIIKINSEGFCEGMFS